MPTKIETKSYILYRTGKVRGMTGLNSTLITPLLVRFDTNGITYRLWMNSTNYPETNYALVTCTGVVDPNNQNTSQQKNIARLVRVYTKGNITEENHGDFYVSFSLNVTNP